MKRQIESSLAAKAEPVNLHVGQMERIAYIVTDHPTNVFTRGPWAYCMFELSQRLKQGIRSTRSLIVGVAVTTILTVIEPFLFARFFKVSPESLALVAVIERDVVASLPVARARRTVVVIVDPDMTRSSDPECSMRDQLRQIIEIARTQFGAAAVVADFTLDPIRVCQSDSRGGRPVDLTQRLEQTAVKACTTGRSPMPVVFGFDLNWDGDPQPSVPIGTQGLSKCRMAITNTNTDWRVLQVQWPVHGEYLDTVAFAAARELDPAIEQEIEPNTKSRSVLYMKPFSHFSYEGRTFLASDIFRANNSAKTTPPPGSVWVIGSKFGEPDGYTGVTVTPMLGEQPGYFRQAAYLESLLEKSYLREAPIGVTVLIIVVSAWWTWLLERKGHHLKAGVLIVLLGTVGFIVLQSLLIWLGFYSQWASSSVISIYVWFAFHIGRSVRRLLARVRI